MRHRWEEMRRVMSHILILTNDHLTFFLEKYSINIVENAWWGKCQFFLFHYLGEST